MYSIGDRVRVRLDRVDTVEHKLQFALAEESGRVGKRKKRS
jgi:tetrahydromethanopterin S-methyltransferase subunit G